MAETSLRLTRTPLGEGSFDPIEGRRAREIMGTEPVRRRMVPHWRWTMERVTATRSELLARRAQISMAGRGRDVLREKREQLMRELRETGDVIVTTSDALEAALAGGRRALARAEAIDGPDGVRSAAVASGRQLAMTTHASTLMGVRIIEILAEPSTRRSTTRGYSMAGSSARIDDVAGRFESVVDQFLEYARYELRLRHLVEEVRTTTRQVNALETVVIPGLQHDCDVIRSVLDERERQDRFRLKRAAERRSARRAAGGVR
jgi:V/A-type H+-transporting ATPase subunit D